MAKTASITPPVTYANAQVRGQLRLWKAALAGQYLILDRAIKQPSKWEPMVDDLVKRGSDKGRRRAFDKLKKLFGPAAQLEGLRLDGSKPLAVWSLLKPRGSVTMDAAPESGRAQDCVTVNYLLAGAWPSWPTGVMSGVTEGQWTLEVPDHALGRAVERSGILPDTIIRDAHHNLLRLRTQQIAPGGGTAESIRFLVRGGAGGFVCTMSCRRDISLNGALDCRVFAHTWLADTQLHEDQVLLADDGLPGERLCDSYLLPAVLRRLSTNSRGQVECVAAPALPDLLSAPQGRA